MGDVHPQSAGWPDALDSVALGSFFVLAILLPALGYVFLVADLRRWMRSFERALVRVVNYLPDLPGWARRETPRCVAALGLRMPCTEHDLKRAYRQKVKQLHPDRGGDQQRFLYLQSQFEQALSYLESHDRA